jgi:electron transfer flavoprotein beta subunit
MKVLVAVKRVVDFNIRIRVRPDGSGVETNGVRMSMNPFCKNAVEAAIALKDAGHAEELIAVSIGPKQSNDVLLTAMAMGIDRSILIETDDKIEPLGVAKLLRAVVDEEQPDLVLLGKQAVDDDANQTGQMLAGLLDWPQATFASRIEVMGEGLTVTREVDFGRVSYALPLPAIVTADLRLNTPRNAALPMVMKARQKPMDIRPAGDFGIDLTPRLKVEKVSPPPERPAGRTLSSLDELTDEIVSAVEAMEAN